MFFAHGDARFHDDPQQRGCDETVDRRNPVPLWDFGMIEALYCNSWYFDVRVTSAGFCRSTSLRSQFFTAILDWYEQYSHNFVCDSV